MIKQLPRLLYADLVLLLGLADGLFNKTITLDANAQNVLAAFGGAFVLRLVVPDKMSIARHLSGWTVGTITALILGSTVSKKLPGWDVYAVYGLVGFLADLTLQLLALLMTKAKNNPGEAFDESLERVEKVTSVWVRIKTPFLDLLNAFKK